MQDPITLVRGELHIAKGAHQSLGSKQRQTMRHGLSVAAERFDDHAKEFDKAHEAQPSANWDRMAEQFRQQAKDTRDLIDLMDGDEEDENSSAAAVIFVKNAAHV